MELPTPVAPLTLTEAERVVIREFFAGPHGQKYLQVLHSHIPSPTSQDPAFRTLQHEQRWGAEQLFNTALNLLNPVGERVKYL